MTWDKVQTVEQAGLRNGAWITSKSFEDRGLPTVSPMKKHLTASRLMPYCQRSSTKGCTHFTRGHWPTTRTALQQYNRPHRFDTPETRQ
ncbi:unnamed protein product [Strongylus vulgaris]|uniref:Uncharacterized protein n=1 Tax=Strongylus vulgaris TaxID=40348 RepID=A0A3P7IEG9_STRVU|nr:unnamed protein product [Strongylus vulgaris]